LFLEFDQPKVKVREQVVEVGLESDNFTGQELRRKSESSELHGDVLQKQVQERLRKRWRNGIHRKINMNMNESINAIRFKINENNIILVTLLL
jgi:hypothetical protein